ADTVFTWQTYHQSFRIGSPLDAGWLVFFLCVGAAALDPSMRDLDAPGPAASAVLTKRRFAVLLAVAALLVPTIVTLRAGNEVPLFLTASIALFGLVLARMFGVVKAWEQ